MGMKRGLTLREEHRLMVFENRVLGNIFGLKECKIIGAGKKCIMKSFITCTLPHT
jgi:hypothetical protein